MKHCVYTGWPKNSKLLHFVHNSAIWAVGHTSPMPLHSQ